MIAELGNIADPRLAERLTGTYKALRWSGVKNRSRLTPGASIGIPTGPTGTLGFWAMLDGDVVGVSNWHVLQGRFEDVYQPGLADWGNIADRGGLSVGDVVAGGVINDTVDAGWFDPWRVGAASNQLGRRHRLSANPIQTEPIEAEEGMKVFKLGRTTGMTEGIVKRKGVVRIGYPDYLGGSQDIECWEVRPEQPQTYENHIELSLPGDSGAAWWTEVRGKYYLVGLHIAGESSGIPTEERAFFCCSVEVFNWFGFDAVVSD